MIGLDSYSRHVFCPCMTESSISEAISLTAPSPSYDPRHDKTYKSPSLIWSWLCAQWVAKDPSFLHADSEDSNQTGRMPRLIWVFAGRTLILLVLSCRDSCVRVRLQMVWAITYAPFSFPKRCLVVSCHTEVLRMCTRVEEFECFTLYKLCLLLTNDFTSKKCSCNYRYL